MEPDVEKLIISSLIRIPEFRKNTAPYIKKEYFQNPTEKRIFDIVHSHITKFGEGPNLTQLMLDAKSENWSDWDSVKDTINDIWEMSLPTDMKWLMERAEKFCQGQAIYNAIIKSIAIYEGEEKNLQPMAIPEMLREAVSVSFDDSIGMDLFDDLDQRWEYFNNPESRTPFRIQMLNEITSEGIPSRTLNIAMAGCVHPATKVGIRVINEYSGMKVFGTEIKNVKKILKDSLIVEVLSPDGWVPVSRFVDKGIWDEYVLELENGIKVRCNENHLFETGSGWEMAKGLVGRRAIFMTEGHDAIGTVVKTGKRIPIVDIEVDHPNHRYYTNGVSSHNTNAGKSMFLISLAADYIRDGIDVLYVSMEMREEEIFRRIDANLLGCTIAEVTGIEKDKYINRICSLKKRSYGDLKVKAYPPGAANSTHFQHLLGELKNKKSFVPRVLIVDYLGIIDSSRIKVGTQGSYFYLKAASEELRALAVENDAILWTAVQLNREGLKSSDFELSDIAESAGIAHTADFILGLIRTEELDEAGQVLIKQLKNRYSNKTKQSRFVLGVNLEMQKFYDVNEGAQLSVAIPEAAMAKMTGTSVKDKFKALNGG